LAKFCQYQKISNILFIAFTIVWIVTRCVYFPFQIIHRFENCLITYSNIDFKNNKLLPIILFQHVCSRTTSYNHLSCLLYLQRVAAIVDGPTFILDICDIKGCVQNIFYNTGKHSNSFPFYSIMLLCIPLSRNQSQFGTFTKLIKVLRKKLCLFQAESAVIHSPSSDDLLYPSNSPQATPKRHKIRPA
jgi:hypothetical protein